MNLNNHSEHIDDLIAKYFLGEATAEEQQEVLQWKSLSGANEKYFAQMQKLLQHTSTAPRFDTNAAWKKVQQQIAEKPSGKIVPFYANKYFLRIAAAIVGVLLVSVVIFNNMNTLTQTHTLMTNNETLNDTLPGGAIVFLNKNTTLESIYNARKKQHLVKLSGEAFFDINKKPDEQFIIETGNIFIEDIGTAFNVKSYVSENEIIIAVQHGEVLLYASEKEKGISVSAREQGIFDKATQTFSKQTWNDQNTLAYKTRLFRFNDMALKEVVASLNSVYETKINISSAIENCHITFNIDNETIEVVADVIAETLGLEKSVANDTIQLNGSGCNSN